MTSVGASLVAAFRLVASLSHRPSGQDPREIKHHGKKQEGFYW